MVGAMRLLLPALAAALLLAGCGSETSGPVPAKDLPNPANAAPLPSDDAPTIAATGLPALTDAERCHTAGLKVSLGYIMSTTSGKSISVVLVNAGQATCALQGSPTITLADNDRNAVTTNENQTGSTLRVDLKPGAQATSTLSWAVTPVAPQTSKDCPTTYNLIVTPPGETTSLAVALPITACGAQISVTALAAA